MPNFGLLRKFSRTHWCFFLCVVCLLLLFSLPTFLCLFFLNHFQGYLTRSCFFLACFFSLKCPTVFNYFFFSWKLFVVFWGGKSGVVEFMLFFFGWGRIQIHRRTVEVTIFFTEFFTVSIRKRKMGISFRVTNGGGCFSSVREKREKGRKKTLNFCSLSLLS